MKILKYLVCIAALCVVGGLLYPSVIRDAPVAGWIGSTYTNNVDSVTGFIEGTGEPLNLEYVSARENARKAAVKVITPSGRGSGTYFRVGRYYIVVTAQHVVDDNPMVLIEGRNGELVYGQPILRGTETDVAVVLVPELNSREPLRYRPMPLPRDMERLVGKDVTYTGFPSSHDLMTIDGKIAGFENGHVIIHSYGWPGSSGSGVFDMRGRMMGVVSAVDIGRWNYMIPPALVEDIVWVAPIWEIAERDIEAYLQSRGE